MSRGFNHRHGYDSGPLPPGFPDSESECHIKFFRWPTRPWETGSFRRTSCEEVWVPRSYSVRDLMNHLGCRNSNPAQNLIMELAESPSGTFSQGSQIRGDDNQRMNKTLRELGYDGSSSGGHHPHVWLWISNNGLS